MVAALHFFMVYFVFITLHLLHPFFLSLPHWAIFHSVHSLPLYISICTFSTVWPIWLDAKLYFILLILTVCNDNKVGSNLIVHTTKKNKRLASKLHFRDIKSDFPKYAMDYLMAQTKIFLSPFQTCNVLRSCKGNLTCQSHF